MKQVKPEHKMNKINNCQRKYSGTAIDKTGMKSSLLMSGRQIKQVNLESYSLYGITN